MANRGRNKKKRDISAEQIFLEFSDDFTDEEAEKAINDTLCDIVKRSIEETRNYQAKGETFDTSIGVVLGLNNHAAIIELRKRVYHRSFDCDYALECNYHPKSANFCYTRFYKKCPGYRQPKQARTSKSIGKTFHLN